ncbi:DUF1343 domain-containing protein [Paenibacillus sp.]|uniref:exo-beta-N-acetylmuramidase NamZ family protein n=1 Tax=Paenibacillus sp. TaxID=58172 RepID=UPI002D4E162C|nr:DUF1343 domain-containing protein [Paenibacillus sp.]HZG85680.1 DUF1343 domain-containing protein [Paenibacillus sp.]
MPRVVTGLARLARDGDRRLAGKRVGLITNPTGVTAELRTAVDVCRELPGVRLTALFACEHGLNGERQAGVRFEDGVHPALGIPVYSLYGPRKAPDAATLADVDAVLFDMQDLGLRFYTYGSTLVYVMRACAEHGVPLFVLDRPNPLGGLRVEGGLLRPGFESMVGAWPMPVKTGMTIGETALMANDALGIGCDVRVVPMEGWPRAMEFPETGLPWMLPSPNIPTIETARAYAGTCFFEGTNVSEGRGTTRPFEWIGAPWFDGRKVADAMNALRLPGVRFHPVYATPTFSKHAGELCGGVRLFVTEPAAYEAVRTGLTLLHTVARLHPDAFAWLPPFRDGMRPFIDLLAGGEDVRLSVAEEAGLHRVLEAWARDADIWTERRKPFLLY